MELLSVIRRWHHREHMPIREIARRTGLSRNTIRKYLRSNTVEVRFVERTIAWLNRCRRLAKDWERLNRNALAFLRWASIRLMLRRLCQKTT